MGNNTTKSQSLSNRNRPKKNVHWKSAECPSRPGKPIQMPGADASKDVLLIRWEKPYTDGGSPIIGYLVEQRRVGSPAWTKISSTLIPYPEITLTDIERTWRYQFRVFAQNVVGLSEPSAISDPISISSHSDSIGSPQFLNEIQNSTVLENEPCEFHINVIGSPPPVINWFKDGFEIFSNRRAKIINDAGSSTLMFHQIALTDEGEIKCAATNRYGHVVTRFYLRIDAPPKIRLPRQYEDGLLVEAGESIKLKVGLAGRPIPVITWLHNNEIVTSGDRNEITTNDKNSFLKLTKVTRTDRGEYNVRAINKLGEFGASFLVTVTAKPRPPRNVRITMSLGKSVTLMWDEPDDDGGCKIGNYIVEYFRLGWDVWLKASSTRQLTATLNDLIEGSEYKFRVKAESPYGMSEPSDESRTLFIPDRKRGIISASDHPNINDSAHSNNMEAGKKINISSDTQSNKELLSQIYHNENIVKEMSYGTSVETKARKKYDSLDKENRRAAKYNHRPPTSTSDENHNLLHKTVAKSETIPVTDETHLGSIDDSNKDALNVTASDEVHTSSEFMLVLYDNKKQTREPVEANNFSLDLKEAIEETPLCLSTPNLYDLSQHNSFQPLRRSASSSELLYEKAMQRFYQAVQLEETNRSANDNAPKLRRDYLDDTNENNSILESVGESLATKIISKAPDKDENEDRDLRQEILESQRNRENQIQLSDENLYEDYTESTASTGSTSMSESTESMECFMQSVRTASRNSSVAYENPDEDLKTYHPRMEMRALSPYRIPAPGQSAVILNKPVPLPDPDFVPVSILKRTSNDKIHSDGSDKPSEKDKETETDRTQEIEKEKERAKELEQERELAQEIEKEKERERERERAKEKEREKQRGLEQEKAREMKRDRERALEMEREREQEREKEREREREKEREREREWELKKEREREIEREREREKELEREQEKKRETDSKQKTKEKEMQKEAKAKQKEATKSPPSTPKIEKERRSFLNLFSKRTTSTECTKKQPASEEANYKKALRDLVKSPKAEKKAIESDAVQTQLRTSIDDSNIMIDHYSDLVRELGGKLHAKPTIPLYMNKEALQEAAARAEREEREFARKQDQTNEMLSTSQGALNDDVDTMELLEVARKMSQYTDEMTENNAQTDNNDLVEISVEHTQSVSYALREIKQPVKALRNDIFVEGNIANLTETTKIGDASGRMAMVAHTTATDTPNSVISRKHPIISRHRSENLERRSKSKSPLTERKTSLTSTVLKVTRRPIAELRNNNGIQITNSSSPPPSSPSPSSTPVAPLEQLKRCKTPDQLQVDAETKVRSTLSYTTDLAMFLLACWIYIFHDVRYVIPILILMVYRRIKDAVDHKLRKWKK